jgi:hypothetical protein
MEQPGYLVSEPCRFPGYPQYRSIASFYVFEAKHDHILLRPRQSLLLLNDLSVFIELAMD